MKRARSCKQRIQKRRRSRGMMLMEILIVVAIISLIAGGVAVAAINYFSRARIQTATTSARTVRAAVKGHAAFAATAECPGFDDLVKDGALDEDSPRADPWGHLWRIVCEDGRISVGSDGPDGKPGTPDDIWVPAKRG